MEAWVALQACYGMASADKAADGNGPNRAERLLHTDPRDQVSAFDGRRADVGSLR